ncbi:MAG: hypothetical protein U9N72_06690 [Bacteroidota bacterium]|nr:hypothetical protein [Bacteroidota bacterium]
MSTFSRIILLILLLVLAKQNLAGQSHGWSVNPPDYAYNGEVTAIIFLGSDEVTTGTLGAFVDGECRGYADGSLFPPTGKTVFTVMCYSNESSGETLNFQYYVYDAVEGNTYYDINETVEFVSDMIKGTAAEPLEFHITVNNPPVVSNPVEDQILYETFGTHTIDLSTVFDDLDGPTADYSAVSSNTSVVTVSVAGSILTISEAGLGTSTITATLSDGEYSVDDVFDVTVYEIPDAIAGEDREICLNESTTLGAPPIDGHTYSWTSDPAGFTSTEANPTVTPQVTTTYTLVETITATGATNSNSVTVTVNPLPTISILDPAECAPDLETYSVSVTVSSGTVTSTAGTVTNTGTNEWTISGVTAGTDITLTVTDGNSCESTLEVTSPDCSCPVIAAPVSGGDEAYCAGDEIPTISASVEAGETVDWYGEATGGSPLLQNSLTYTPATPGTYYAEARNTTSDCTSSTRTAITVTENPLPAAAGSISGPATFTPGTTGVEYSVSPIANATGYIWAYSGTGVTINGTGANVTLDFSLEAAAGTLTVKGTNSCGNGEESALELQSEIKTLNLTSVFLQGLYDSSGQMRQAWDESGPHWEAGVADHISIELHSSTGYSTVVYTAEDVPLNTDGTATVTIPATYGDSYYITIKHRNSIETTTASVVSFAGGTINQSFGSRSEVYGGNLGESGDGYYVIYAGDVNQDGYIDTQDFVGVDNDSYNYRTGYLVTDVDGNGVIDTNDFIFIDNNNYNYIGAILP